MAKIILTVTVSDYMSDATLQELTNAITMWRNVHRVEVSKETAQQRASLAGRWICSNCGFSNPAHYPDCWCCTPPAGKA